VCLWAWEGPRLRIPSSHESIYSRPFDSQSTRKAKYEEAQTIGIYRSRPSYIDDTSSIEL
jgi:hypothetical protein